MGRRENREADGFAKFIDAHEQRLRQAFASLLGPTVGREATVEALSYGWEHWERVSAMDNPVGYLYVVGRERATRHARRRRDIPSECPFQASADPVMWYEPALPGLVEELSNRERQVVMLLHGFEWSMSEIAELLEMSKSSVQSYADRAMAKLRRGLGVPS